MTTLEFDIAKLLPWGKPREVSTKVGPRILRKAEPSPEFWQYWNQFKAELKQAGLSATKDLQTGKFQVCWWQPLGEADQAKREANTELSRAATTDFEPPKPDGLEYRPFQKVGVEFALKIWGDL